ncbi:MAG: MBL fold metallo-hydrolase [Solobacterium sp.]|nr:MBL fold metallo-hydrolase [Solobacterium sp.]
MSRFTARDLGHDVIRIEGQGAVGMYLVIGEKKAVLLDTALGANNIREYVQTLTDRPVEVYLTHGHLDHAGGMYWFDEVHMSHKDLGMLKGNSKQDRIDYLNLIRSIAGNSEWTEDDVCDVRDISVVDIADGEVIDLGGRTLTAIDFSGHTRGSMAFYDDRSGYLFVGDCCNNSTFLFLEDSTSLTHYLESLKRIKEEWMPKVSHMVICHDYDFVPADCIDNVAECCRLVLEGKDDQETFVHPNPMFAGMPVRWAKKGGADRTDGKFGNIAYNYKKVN